MSSHHGTRTEEESTFPRAIIHKQILEAAEMRPDATFAELAAQVSGASENLVKRVLSDYGDPVDEEEIEEAAPAVTEAADVPETKTNVHTESDTKECVHPHLDDAEVPEFTSLSDPQRETIRAIYHHSEMTQRELADLLDVSAPTINSRVSSIENFEWSNRQAFATAMIQHHDSQVDTSTPLDEELESTTDRLTELTDRLEQLEREIDSQPRSPLMDTELTHKVIHACMSSETITNQEELRIIEQFIDHSSNRK